MKKQLLLGAIATSAFAVGSAMVAPQANALTLETGSTTCSISDFTGSSACEGAFDSNQPKQDVPGATLFGTDDWEFLMKEDGDGLDGIQAVTFTGLDDTSGTWAFAAGFDYSAYEKLFFFLKGGDTFSAYLWDGSTTSGTFTTAGILKGNDSPSPDLSNFGVFGIPGEPTDVVPTPAAVLPILGGLFGFASRRKNEGSEEA